MNSFNLATLIGILQVLYYLMRIAVFVYKLAKKNEPSVRTRWLIVFVRMRLTPMN